MEWLCGQRLTKNVSFVSSARDFFIPCLVFDIYLYRMRKIEKINQLDAQVGRLKEQNFQLTNEGDTLRWEVRQLKDSLEKHVKSGECKKEGSMVRNCDSTC